MLFRNTPCTEKERETRQERPAAGHGRAESLLLRLHIRDLLLERLDLLGLGIHLALVLALLVHHLLVCLTRAHAATEAETEGGREEQWHAVPEAERRVATADDDVGGAPC